MSTNKDDGRDSERRLSMSAYSNANLEDVLDDLSCRFIVNLPAEELVSVARICFQIEQAHWYYEDFIREQNPHLPSLQLRLFSKKIFEHCPLLWKWNHLSESAYDEFLTYKTRVPVRGAVLIDSTMDKCVLVKSYKGSSWSFPRGKINRDESDFDCAMREVYEETGFDATQLAHPDAYFEVTIREQNVRLYIVPNVPVNTEFMAQTRKEISAIEWVSIKNLPSFNDRSGRQQPKASSKRKFYMVAPFVPQLQLIVAQYQSQPLQPAPPSSPLGKVKNSKTRRAR